MPFTVHPEPQVPARPSQPGYRRLSDRTPEYHPTHIARAKLGDTKGAVFLPLYDSLPSPFGIPTNVSLFGGSSAGTLTPATLHTPLPSPGPNEGVLVHNQYDSAYDRIINEYRNNAQLLENGLPQSESDSAVSDSFRKASNTGSQLSVPIANPRPALIRQATFGQQLEKRHCVPVSAQKSADTSSQRVAGSTDGASDDNGWVGELNPWEASLSSLVHPVPSKPRVCFASNEELRMRYDTHQADQHSSPFLNPFTGNSAPDDIQGSDTSDASSYFRQNAFTGHRDTFARLRDFDTEEDDFEVQSEIKSYSIDFSNDKIRRFPGHRDTIARLHFRQSRMEAFPARVHERMLQFLTSEDYKNLRLTCRRWANALTPPVMPAATRLPAEVLQQVFESLQPCDFDAARHTCRSWFLASLDRHLGRQMLKKAGCHSAFVADVENRRHVLHSKHLNRIWRSEVDEDDEDDDIEEDLSEDWLISKRLATEAKLSATWQGAGLLDDNAHTESRLTVTKTIQFEGLTFSDDDDHLRAKRFIVSDCGKLLLVVVGTDIFVYSMGTGNASIIPRVRLVTGKQVLGVSMNTSSGRHAVAALLEGRVGMCWELDGIFTDAESATEMNETMSFNPQSGSYDLGSPAGTTKTGLLLQVQQSSWSFSDLETWSKELSIAVPIRTKPTNLYKNLGSPGDLAQTVAICPQRQCVAYGCRTGIELYWVDALTGRNLNRWFPLAAPSDHLYFLPQRAGFDSAKKLRLVSSAAAPSFRTPGRHNSTPLRSDYNPTNPLHGRRQSMTRLFFGNVPFPASSETPDRLSRIMQNETQGVLRTVDCDHYNAIPLSDGTHMLFVDPVTSLLCLGSDAPLGGPTKLVRKVCMLPPTPEKSTMGLPTCYAAAQNLEWGVRVVAAYEDGSIVLYNIPSDCFERIRYIRASPDIWDELSGVVGQSDLMMDNLMADNPDNLNGSQPINEMLDSSVPTTCKSLQIHGALLTQMDSDVEDLHVDCSGGGFRLWIFHRSGQAMKMDIYAPRNHQVKSYAVGVDGLLRDVSSSSGGQQDSCSNVVDSSNGATGSSKPRIKFMGLDGACDYDYANLEEKIEVLENLNTEFCRWHPGPVINGTTTTTDSVHERLQLEVFTDWRDAQLLTPYLVSLN